MSVRLARPLDVISGLPQDGQIRSLGDALGMLEGDVLGTSWGPIFAGWVTINQFARVKTLKDHLPEVITFQNLEFY